MRCKKWKVACSKLHSEKVLEAELDPRALVLQSSDPMAYCFSQTLPPVKVFLLYTLPSCTKSHLHVFTHSKALTHSRTLYHTHRHRVTLPHTHFFTPTHWTHSCDVRSTRAMLTTCLQLEANSPTQSPCAGSSWSMQGLKPDVNSQPRVRTRAGPAWEFSMEAPALALVVWS